MSVHLAKLSDAARKVSDDDINHFSNNRVWCKKRLHKNASQSK